jgi:uncharacterized repeat protein (TIGR01451 family)
MNIYLERSEHFISETHLSPPQKRNHFTQSILIAMLAFALGNMIPTVNFAQDSSEPNQTPEATDSSESISATVPSEPEYVVHGTITDTDGNALAEVSVQVGDKTAISDERGIWEITGLPEGEYALVASHENYAFSAKDLKLTGEENAMPVTLETIPAIFGTIVDPFGNPIEGVTVEVADKTAVTDEDGQWQIIDLSEGEYTALASHEAYVFAPKTVTLGTETIKTEVALKIVSTLFGRIVDIFGNPLENVVVQAGDKETLSNELGQWKITDLSEGEYTVTANKEGIEYWFLPEPITVVGNQIQEVNMELVTGFGTIKDKFNDPIADVTVRIYKKDTVNNEGLLATAVTNEEGYWEATGLLAPNEYTVVASKHRYIFEQKGCMVNLNGLCEPELSKPNSVLEMTINAPETVVQDNNVSYAITVTNRGDQTASGIVVTDDLPKGTELVSAYVSWYTYYPIYHNNNILKHFSHCGSVHHTSPCSETSCNLPSLSAGGTCQNRSATVHIVASNHQVNNLRNKVTMTANDFPGDVQYTRTEVVPHFSIFILDKPDPVAIGDFLQYKIDIDLNPNVPKAATGVELKIQLPNGLKLKAVKTDYGFCNTDNLPTIVCDMEDITLEQANSLSHTVGIDVEVTDVGLLLFMFEATVKANEYPAYTVRERTRVDIPNAEQIEVDIAFVVDITGSMQQEIDGVIKALNEFINTLEKGEAELPFEDVLTPNTEENPQNEPEGETQEEETTEDEETDNTAEIAEEAEESVETATEEGETTEGDEVAEPEAPLIALITFADEVKIKAFVKAFTRNMDVLREAINKLKAKGGGTCPEASIEALDFVMPYLKKGGIILFTTDASPYPDANVEGVMESMRSKGIRFNAMITGDCSTENNWNQEP